MDSEFERKLMLYLDEDRPGDYVKLMSCMLYFKFRELRPEFGRFPQRFIELLVESTPCINSEADKDGRDFKKTFEDTLRKHQFEYDDFELNLSWEDFWTLFRTHEDY